MSDPNGWVPIGPSCVPNGQLGWDEEGEGPISGRCTALALDPDHPDEVIYAGTAIGGVWKSMDGGLTWIPKSDFEAFLGIGCLAVDPTNSQRLYVGTGEANEGGEIIPGAGVLVSDTGGDTWTLHGSAVLAPRRVGHLVADPTSPVASRHLFAATTEGLFESLDSGQYWIRVVTPGSNTWITALHLDASAAVSRLYIAVQGQGIYRRDGGGSFVPLGNFSGTPPPAGSTGRIALAVSGSNPAIVYAAYGDPAGRLSGIWRSIDHGDHWTLLRFPLPTETSQTKYNLVLAVDPINPERVFFGETRLWRSLDGGQNWEVVSEPHGESIGLHADQHALVFHPHDPSKIWAGNDGGVFYSSDGGITWSHRNRGLQTLQFYALALHPSSESLALVGSQDNGLQRYMGHPAWRRVRGGDGFHCAIDPVNPKEWYGSYTFASGEAIFHSAESAEEDSFEDIADDAWLSDYTGPKPFYIPFAHSPTENGILYAGTTKLYRFDLSTEEWEAAIDRATGVAFSTGRSTPPGTKDDTITAIAIARSNPSIVFVGTADGRVFRLERGADQLWQVDNRTSGLPRNPVPPPTPPPLFIAEIVSDIAIHPSDPDRVYVALGYEHESWEPVPSIPAGRIFFSVDAGQRWQPRGNAALDVHASGITIQHNSNPVNAIIIDPDNPSHVYIGSDVGVFRSPDEGANWTAWHENLPHSPVSDLQIHRPTRTIRASTRGRSVWERRLDAPAPPATPPPFVDLYVRDNPIDLALRDTREDEEDPLDRSERLNWYSSPDIKVDAPGLLTGSYDTPASTVDYSPSGSIDFIGFESLEHDDPREQDEARVYVQVHNRGPDTATDVEVRVFYSPKRGETYPDLPTNFWAVFPDGDPVGGSWQPIGPAQTISEISPAEPRVASWIWSVPAAPDPTVALMAIVNSPDDPVAEARLVVNEVVRTNKHAALREIEIGMPSTAIFVTVLVAIGAAAVVGVAVATQI